MKNITDSILPHLAKYLDKDPVSNLKLLLDMIGAFGLYKFQKGALISIYEKLEDPTNPYYGFVKNMRTILLPKVRQKFLENFMLRAGLFSKGKRLRLRKKCQHQLPCAVLTGPTSKCNLVCAGCLAKDYAKTDSLSFELMDRIICEGKKMATYVYIFSGGEPLMRKKDIIKLCEKHSECYFMAFTNGTLIDEHFALEIARVGNFAPAISIEGFEEMTDFRRGNGTFKKAIHAMDLLRDHGILFGFSATYHRINTNVIASNDFLDLMEKKGCNFGWYFTYMHAGSDAQPDLIVTPEQRAYMYYRIREVRKQRPMFLVDFSPCLDNPEKLRDIVNNSNAKSTHLNDLESEEHLIAKCEMHAKHWAEVADELPYCQGDLGNKHKRINNGFNKNDYEKRVIANGKGVADNVVNENMFLDLLH